MYVIVLDHMMPRGRDAMSIRELPAHSTVEQLHELLQLQEAAARRSCAATRLMVCTLHGLFEQHVLLCASAERGSSVLHAALWVVYELCRRQLMPRLLRKPA